MNLKIMKLILLMLLLSNNLFSGPKYKFSPKWIYGSIGFENKTKSFNYGATLILKNNYGISFFQERYSKKAQFLPADYHSGGIIWSTNIAYDNFKVQSIRLLKEFDLPHIKLLRLGIEAGPAFCQKEIAHFTHYHTSGWLFSDDGYHTNYTKEKSCGFILRTKVAFPCARFAGLECSFTGTILGKNSSINIGIYNTFGRNRKRLNEHLRQTTTTNQPYKPENKSVPNKEDIEEFYSPNILKTE